MGRGGVTRRIAYICVMAKLSVLDLAPIVEGSTTKQALENSLDLARHAERLGYHRFWLAEHHNMPGIASAATAVVPYGNLTTRIPSRPRAPVVAVSAWHVAPAGTVVA